jgi:hypothetical protein
MNQQRIVKAGVALSILLLALFLGVFAMWLKGPHIEDPPPLPPPEDASVSTVQIIDAGEEDAAEDAAPDAKPGPSGPAPSNILACCNALANAAGQAPPPNNMYFKAAADYCMGASKAPNTRQTLSQITGMLRGASLPTACR